MFYFTPLKNFKRMTWREQHSIISNKYKNLQYHSLAICMRIKILIKFLLNHQIPKICDKEKAIYIKSNEFITCCFTHMWFNYAPLYWVLYTRLVRNQVVQYTKLLALIVLGFKKVPLFGNVRRFLLNLLKFLRFLLLNLHNV